jgi:transcriptional regulator with XRE-family HTH domain
MVHPPNHHPTDLLMATFADRLTAARKHCGLTQQEPADLSGADVTQIRRYEAGTSAPTLDALRNLAIALNITTDSLVFDPDERGPSDDLALHLEAIAQLDPDDQHLIRSIIEAILLRHDTRRWTQAS